MSSQDLLTNTKDVDRLILDELSDTDFLKICSINKTFFKIVCDENYFKRRTEARYPETIPYKTLPTWKKHYLTVVKYIDLLKREYQYEYVIADENPEYLYIAMQYFEDANPNLVSIRNNEDDDNFEYSNEEALVAAIEKRDIVIVKYLVEVQYADKNFYDGEALNKAIEYNNLEIVKYLIAEGADYELPDLIEKAQYNNDPEMLEYLESLEF